MVIQPFDKSNKQYLSEAAQLLVDCFPQAYADCANNEISSMMDDEKIVFMAIENNHLIGFAGAKPQYGITGWELHPLAVRENFRGRKIGTNLVEALEKAAAQKGCITLYLGTDDEFAKTSLANTDLYDDTFTKIVNIRNLKNHPYQFYQKLGYKIVGVIPDANGIGKPDIWMAKKIGN